MWVVSYLSLLCNGVDEEIGADVIHIGYQDGGKFWYFITWVDVLLYSVIPVLPFSWNINTKSTQNPRLCQLLGQ
jgi:hypothetical protein